MANKMLIDATHREETRVVVVRGQRIEEFDYESTHRKQLKGNIYLAKVTRVEPSLQAAFVDYGGNRHGFLAFSEIHPDYYQIPVADRQALLREEREDAVRGDEDDDSGDQAGDETDGGGEDNGDAPAPARNDEDRASSNGESGVENVDEDQENRQVDSVGAEDALEELPRRRQPRRRSYKIQEVVKRRQVLLVQVVKEERGTKGAALTTYLSLAGRYCVLMPNTARGGGISRKITDAGDRRRLKDVTRDIEVPEGMGLIVRTAGAQRTKSEIKRDYDYLTRLWENVRDLTLKSTAPALVYEEGNLIKRAIRDLYGKEVDEILVEGDEGYREAKEFMKMLMPSHARNVKAYKETRPLFARSLVEGQLDALFSPMVTLPSGGYLVLNQTEALVAIDINSGKSTREHSIEDTALRTNLEAADEIARQLRLRDLAGLIVIDFIDMEEKRNNRAVERRVKEALKHDRARIQVGRISHFGLLEMSRQRLRQGMLEGSTRPCPHCEGTGRIRSIASCALAVLREIEESLTRRKAESLTVKCHPDVAFYILNEKREHLLGLENSFGASIFLQADAGLASADSQIERDAARQASVRKIESATVQMDSALIEEPVEEPVEEPDEDEQPEEEAAETGEVPQRGGESGREESRRRRRRRRGRRGGRGTGEDGQEREAPDRNGRAPTEDEVELMAESAETTAQTTLDRESVAPGVPESPEPAGPAVAAAEDTEAAGQTQAAQQPAEAPPAEEVKTPKPRRRAAGGRSRATRAKAKPSLSPDEKTAAGGKPAAKVAPAVTIVEPAPAEAIPSPVAAEPTPATRARKASVPAPAPETKATASVEPKSVEPKSVEPKPSRWSPPKPTVEAAGPTKRGWWAKRVDAGQAKS